MHANPALIRLTRTSLAAYSLLLAAAGGTAAQTPAAAPSGTGSKSTKIFEKLEADAEKQKFSYFLINDSATQVAASSLVGIAPSAMTIVENTRDIAVMLKAFDKDNSGAGFSITPARIKNSFPNISIADYKKSGLEGYWWRAVSAATFSYAQGTGDVSGTSYRRRAATISTSFYLDPEHDDPIEGNIASDDKCFAELNSSEKFLALVASPPKKDESVEDRNKRIDESMNAMVVSSIKDCRVKKSKELNARWYRPLFSVIVGSGDVRNEKLGASARLGTHAAVALRLGGGIGDPTPSVDGSKDKDPPVYGWSLSFSGRVTSGDPVLATLGTAKVDFKTTKVWVARYTAGTETWRALAETSNVRTRQAETGEYTFRWALGTELQFMKSNWLHLRYGSRINALNGKEEKAVMMTATFSGAPEEFK